MIHNDSRIQYYAIRDYYVPWLIDNGYHDCEIIVKPTYQGSVWSYRWIRAQKGGRCYLVFEQDEQDRRRQKLCTVLDLKMIIDTIPTAPQFVEIVSFKPKVIVILEEAMGFANLWEIEGSSDLPSCGELQSALNDFVQSLEAINWIHGDIRPWNVFFDPRRRKFLFIDWWSSNGRTPENTEKDRQDVGKVLDLFSGKRMLEELWDHPYFMMTWNPSWVRRGRAPDGIRAIGTRSQTS